MSGEPILGKRPPQKYDYRLLTWPIFLALRAWAQQVSAEEQADVYLVGSAVRTAVPRDVDVAVVLPRDEFERRFGAIPEPGTDAMKAYVLTIRDATEDRYFSAQHAVRFGVLVDLRFTPDEWWADKPRILLAASKEPQ